MMRAGCAMTALWVLFLLGAVRMAGVLGGALALHLRDARFRAYVGRLVR